MSEFYQFETELLKDLNNYLKQDFMYYEPCTAHRPFISFKPTINYMDITIPSIHVCVWPEGAGTLKAPENKDPVVSLWLFVRHNLEQRYLVPLKQPNCYDLIQEYIDKMLQFIKDYYGEHERQNSNSE